ncbi:penicillin-binding transpeptidase domain-containing protein [Mariniluteicoccus flavus]
MPTSFRVPGRTLLASAIAATLVAATACGGGADGKGAAPTPKPQTADEAGRDLAQRLTSGDLAGFPVKSGDPSKDLADVLKGMGGLRPDVKMDQTIRNGTGATVNLDYTWPLSYPWTYRAKATLANDGGTWKLVWTPEAIHPSLSPETRLERTVGSGSRGGITGAQGAVLVGSSPALMVGIDKAKAGGAAETSARALAELLLIDPAAYADRVAKAPADARVDAIGVHRNALPWGALDRIPGAVQREMTLPVGRDPGFARSIVGTVTTATPADAAASQGRVGAGDIIGRSGLQERFDDTLRGGGESKVFLAPRAAEVGSTEPKKDTILADFQAREGTSVVTTIDANLQSAAEDVLVTANVPIAVAAVRTSDGAILAAAESPAGRGRPDATTGEFHPGLAASPAAVLALVRAGAKPSDKVTCEKSATVGGATIDRPASASASGSMTLAQAAARGCSPALAQQAGRVQPQAYADALADLGLTGQPDLGFAARLGAAGDLAAEGGRAQALAGTDQLTASPLGLAAMAATISSGRPVVPWVTERFRPTSDKQLAPEELKALQDLMKAGGASISGLQGGIDGDVDGRRVVVGYSKDIAYAVVIGDAKTSRVTAESLITKMAAGAARSGSTAKPTRKS